MKQQLRKDALFRRNRISAEERREKSARMQEHIFRSDAYKEAEYIFSYVNMGSEAETCGIFERAWQDGKKVAVPKTEADRVMYFLEISSLAELREGRFGIMEPVGQAADAVVPKIGDLFLVPGAAFDRKKNRLGYGGGYYDTYFAKHRGYRKVGLAFSLQITGNDLPVEETDIPLDDIVTECGWEE